MQFNALNLTNMNKHVADSSSAQLLFDKVDQYGACNLGLSSGIVLTDSKQDPSSEGQNHLDSNVDPRGNYKMAESRLTASYDYEKSISIQ
jgi:hypothetical protein